ncbi:MULTISPECIES: LysR family transcriptional regulator [Pseudomonas]|uniref:LysR family transcriptional regulator n=2 Tax=Pseudomonas TaxID=286 RepID=A0A7Y8G0V8_9PSED|nr:MULTISPECIES: LysR family transcriptional regulator [Pseudomonas]KGE68637.1 LysR family transcriptional regulator [Pseudomonas fluorescens LMG 5329]NWD83491.1 LysR family transcriptional regulator [Pseudomonas reactans]NWE01964.1 LysR family transcriptional regulator [Pseudomonas sp. IPO3749]NWE89167.1 LysR family transcriptional regulator [Pseudomonas reactans]NWF20064.1 LysR family transcriptional regulator [Pseudomonas sp. IPO3749]
MDSLTTLNAFVQVAHTHSFVGAGRVLGITASAVGKSVARLEERLGVRLFHRSTRSVTLTAEGELFLERSRRILLEIEEAEAELSQVSQAPRGRLKVSLPLVGHPFLPVLADFKKDYPDVELDLSFTDRRVDVVEEGYDAVLRSGEAPDSRLSSRLVGDYRMIVVAAPAYLASRGTPGHPSDLAAHSCILFRFPNTGKLQRWPLRQDGVELDMQLPAAMICNNLEARVCFARQGIGLAYLPDFAIREWLESGELVQVLHDCTERGSFRMMWPSSRHPSPKLRVFIDFLKARLFA